MLRLTEIRLPTGHSEADLVAAIQRALGVTADEVVSWHLHRRGHDARKSHHGRREILFVYTLDVVLKNEAAALAHHQGNPRIVRAPDETYRYPVLPASAIGMRPVIIGTGPCGLFAGLSLARMGFRPLLLERGQSVRQRTRDVWAFWRRRQFRAESNVQFGEGGAGTFSDGKLYSGIKDREHRIPRILEDLVECGAPEEIRFISKPHIGTLRLVKVVENLRRRIVSLGGEIRFGAHVTDIVQDSGRVRALTLASGETLEATHVILAAGHSARDTFERLYREGVHMEAKPFSIGFRVEHPQALIDRCQLGNMAGHITNGAAIGAADYKLVHHCHSGRSVYSFCMCPGGQVVAATSEEGRVVTNGMSHYSRADRNANAGIVVGVTPTDFGSDHPLAGIAFQRRLEEGAFALGGGNYNAPAQRVGDFLAGRASTGPGAVIPSYTPGVTWTDLSRALPDYAISAIREAIPAFERQVPVFALPDAVLTGVETRTSSPLRITRDEKSCESVSTRGLYPAGEGAGYAGGILSAAVDGMRVAEAVARSCITRAPSKST